MKSLSTKHLIETITAISKILSTDNNNGGLLTGITGTALFFHELNKVIPNIDHHNNCLRYIENSIDAIENQKLGYSFCSGIAGISWGLEYFSEQGLFEEEEDDYLLELDELIFKCAKSDIEKSNVDFLHGGVGVIDYFIKRLPNIYAEKCLTNFVDLLWEKAEKKGNEITWKNSFNQERSAPYLIKEYNLGLAHGIPSLICILIKIYNKNIASEKCRELIFGSVSWLLNQKLPVSYNSIFPNTVSQETENSHSNLSWCHGDLGIAITLWQAGKTLSQNEWKKNAIDIMICASKRRESEKYIVIDAGICHGTAGIAHMFNRFYWETKQPVFKETANYWIKETLKMAYHPDGLAGYKSWQGAQEGWVKRYSVLEGIAGIGLVLLSHISEEEPAWDRCLLLS